jgi:hypothetical protein
VFVAALGRCLRGMFSVEFSGLSRGNYFLCLCEHFQSIPE